MVSLLLIAWHETTVGLISQSVRLILILSPGGAMS
nr:cytochrome P450 [Spongiactinospora rosea]